MLALLSSPVRRWVLTALLVPALALVLRKIAQFLQRRIGVSGLIVSVIVDERRLCAKKRPRRSC